MKTDTDTFLVQLTVDEFIEILKERFPILAESANKTDGNKPFEGSNFDGRVVYGLRGIQQLFNVSHRMAQYYKDNVIRPAVRQNGRKIVTDVALAYKLFDEHKKKKQKQ